MVNSHDLDVSSNLNSDAGTVQGHGYDCVQDAVHEVEHSEDGIWNKVSSHVDWIVNVIRKYEEELCLNGTRIKLKSHKS